MMQTQEPCSPWNAAGEMERVSVDQGRRCPIQVRGLYKNKITPKAAWERPTDPSSCTVVLRTLTMYIMYTTPKYLSEPSSAHLGV